MSYTLAQLNTLNDAIAQGARKVKYADKEVEYRSLDEMRSVKAEMEAELFPKPSPQKNRTVAVYSKGL